MVSRKETVRQMRACLDIEGSSLLAELTVKIQSHNIWPDWTKICLLKINDKLSGADSVGAQIELDDDARFFF